MDKGNKMIKGMNKGKSNTKGRNQTLKYSLFTSLLVALGPILWLFINIGEKRYEFLPLNIIAVIIASTGFLFCLRLYLRDMPGRSSLKIIIKLVVDFLFYITLIGCLIILFIGFYMAITIIQEKLFVKGEYIMYMIKSPYSYLTFIILVLVTEAAVIFSNKKNKEKSLLPKRYLLLIVAVLTYVLLTSVVVITKDGIYDYSFYNLKGNIYKFSEIKQVNAGFKDSGMNKGEFFYTVEFKNGKSLKLGYPSMIQPGQQYNEDSWQEYVDLDGIIMKAGAKKYSSEAGSEHILMDQVYIDKLLKVVRNK